MNKKLWLKKYTAKQAIIMALTAAMALVNFLALAFTLVSGEFHSLSADESFFENGFTLAFGEAYIAVEECGAWLEFYCLLHFVLSLAAIAALALRALLRSGKTFGFVGVVAVALSAVTSTAYFVSGCVASSIAEKFGGGCYEVVSLAFLPFATVLIMLAALFAVQFLMPDDYVIRLK